MKIGIIQLPELVKLLLPQTWQLDCEIIPEYMPPFPREDTRPTCVLKYVSPKATPCQILLPKGGSGMVRTSVCEYEQELHPNSVENPIKAPDWFLRHSKGPLQGYFWDMYGDDFLKPELALWALAHASAPPGVSGHDHNGRVEIQQ